MDSFMDKIHTKFGASDMIKANSEAEAKELESAKAKIIELEKAVSDMRRLSLKTVETNEATTQLVASAIEKIEEFKASGNGEDTDLSEVTKALSELKESIDGSFKASSEEAHKENVRVYRNVQASVIDELKQQSEAIAMQHMHIEGKMRGIKPISIVALVLSSLTFLGMVAAYVLWFLKIGF